MNQINKGSILSIFLFIFMSMAGTQLVSPNKAFADSTWQIIDNCPLGSYISVNILPAGTQLQIGGVIHSYGTFSSLQTIYYENRSDTNTCLSMDTDTAVTADLNLRSISLLRRLATINMTDQQTVNFTAFDGVVDFAGTSGGRIDLVDSRSFSMPITVTERVAKRVLASGLSFEYQCDSQISYNTCSDVERQTEQFVIGDITISQ